MKLTPLKSFLLFLPCLLLPSTALVFVFSARWFGQDFGYLIGFIFYWVFWCVTVPALILKRSGLIALFKDVNPLFNKSNWIPAALWIAIVAITVGMYPPNRLFSASGVFLAIAIPVAIVNGFCEEILWRGLYVKSFPGNWLLGVIIPSIGFALWHIAPQLLVPAGIGIWPFVLSTLFLGLGYGLISYRTGSIKWNGISHSLGGILDLAGAIAPSIYVLFFR